MAREAGLELREAEKGLELQGDGMVMCADFADLLPRVRPDRLSGELLVKAARIKGVPRPCVFDATAGLGEDSFLLAAAGCEVVLCEANPVIAALLGDALERASRDERLAPIASRMHLSQADSIEVLKAIAAALGDSASSRGEQPESGDARPHAGVESVPAPLEALGVSGASFHPDVVYLDPMFPARQKSAAVKKKFQLLHRLECPCANEEELMGAALGVVPRKIVVKRPPKAPCLAGVKPSHSIEGKAVRYDCIVPAQLKH